MKVSQPETTFKPVTIVLETKEELNNLISDLEFVEEEAELEAKTDILLTELKALR